MHYSIILENKFHGDFFLYHPNLGDIRRNRHELIAKIIAKICNSYSIFLDFLFRNRRTYIDDSKLLRHDQKLNFGLANYLFYFYSHLCASIRV